MTQQSWQGKSKGNKLGYGIFIAILKYAGVKPAYFLLRFVSFYYFLFSRSSSRHIYYFFRKRMGFNTFRSLRGLYNNYFTFGQILIDKIVVMSGLKVPYTFEFEGEHYLEEINKGGKGGILIGAHVGNYELAGHYFKRITVKVNIVMVDKEHQRIKEYLESVMSDRNLNIITIKEDLSHIYEISTALQNNELVAIHADRYVEGNRIIEGTLLGGKAKFPIGPFAIATTFKVPVSFVHCYKENTGHYHLYTSAPKEYTGNKQTAIPEALNDYIKDLEMKLQKYPEQWFNYFSFWEEEKKSETNA